MDKAGWGNRIKARARELGLTDVAVARMLGMAQRKFSAYANETREPNFETLSEICRALRTTPNAILGFDEHPRLSVIDATVVRLEASIARMDERDREKALAVLEAMAKAGSQSP